MVKKLLGRVKQRIPVKEVPQGGHKSREIRNSGPESEKSASLMNSRPSLSLRMETGRSGGSGRHRCSGGAGSSSSPFPPGSALDRIARLVSENAVIIFGFNGCCMCHVARQLLCGMGVNPTLYELDEEEDGGSRTEDALIRIAGRDPAVPAVFIGGKFVGGVERLMSIHIKGNLVPMLKDAGALWL